MFEAEPLTVDGTCVDDRRRAGRVLVAPSLLPLLRNPAGSGVVLEDAQADEWALSEPLAPSRSIGLALAVCLPVWCIVGGALYAVLH